MRKALLYLLNNPHAANADFDHNLSPRALAKPDSYEDKYNIVHNVCVSFAIITGSLQLTII